MHTHTRTHILIHTYTHTYTPLPSRFHQLQVSSDARLSKLQSELQVKQFESEKTHVLHEEASRGLRQCELEQEKLRKKVEVLTQELWSVQNEGAVRVRELEGRLQEAKERLEVYEKLEKEMDDVIMQAAQSESAFTSVTCSPLSPS